MLTTGLLNLGDSLVSGVNRKEHQRLFNKFLYRVTKTKDEQIHTSDN